MAAKVTMQKIRELCGLQVIAVLLGAVVLTTAVAAAEGPKAAHRLIAGKGHTVYGGAGNDQIAAEGGKDVNFGGAGADVMPGDAAFQVVDFIDGGDGDDVISAGGGDDILNGGEGADVLAGNAGNDRLEGGAGADILNGGEGDDVYLFDRGFGIDRIDESAGFGTDTIRFGADISAAEVTVARRESGDLVLSLSLQDQVTVVGQYRDGSKIERIEFGDGVTLTLADLDALPVSPIVGTDGPESLSGVAAQDGARRGLQSTH
jgi:Ca2+-binding RTX toxin-like protein